MMPVVSVAPVMAMVPRGAVTDLPRTVGGLHDAAAWPRDAGGVIIIGIVVIIRVVVVTVKNASNEDAMPVPEPVMEPVASNPGTAGKMADPCPTGGGT